MRLVTVGSILVTSALAHAGALYPRMQSVKIPPPTKTRPVVATAATPTFSVMALVGPPGMSTPPAPGEIAKLEAVDVNLLSHGREDHLFDLAAAYGRQMLIHQANATAHTARANAAIDAAIRARATSDATSESSSAKNMLLKSVKTFKTLFDGPAYAAFTREPDALFTYGFILQSMKYMKEARVVYDRLLKNHPASAHVPSAHFVFAEYYIEAGQLADGEVRLRQVLKFPKSNLYWVAMYRMGFIHMQLQRHVEALETYFQVAMGTRGNSALTAVAEAARRGFVAAYVPIGKPDKALPAFQRVDAAHALEMLGWLAEGYMQAGMHTQAQTIYAQLGASKPAAAAPTCETAANTARSVLAGAPSLALAVGHVESLLMTRAKLESSGAMTASVAGKCRLDAIEIAGDTARALHIEALKTLDPLTFGAAVTLYQSYGDSIPDAPDVAAMRVLGAEAAWTHADVRGTPELWERAAQAFAALPPKTGDAALAAVLAWKNALAASPNLALQAGTFDIAALPATPSPSSALSPRAAGLVAAVDAYAGVVANQDDDELLRGHFLAATLYRGVHDYHRAAKILEDLVPRLGRRGDHASRELAANLLLETLARDKQFDRVLQVADGFAADKAFLDRSPALRKSIEYLRTHSLRR